jgi:hypothetical protein
MARYCKKPVVIEAVQVLAAVYNGKTWNCLPFKCDVLPQWLEDAFANGTVSVHPSDRGYALLAIKAPEGTMIAEPGDWIIRGVKGELYPCKPDIFEFTYAATPNSVGLGLKTGAQVEGSKPRSRKTKGSKVRERARFIGTRPLKVTMQLRGQLVDVKVVPAVSTTTHVNYQITITRAGTVLHWVPTRDEIEQIGRTVAMHTELQISH